METIEKVNEAAAHPILDAYLVWAATNRWYGIGCGRKLYEKLRIANGAAMSPRKQLVQNILLPEQNHRCCYCMRHFDTPTDDVTIEHIAPQHTSTRAELFSYFTHRSRGLNSANVCLTDDYIVGGFVGAPYPLHVAYHNMVIACSDCNSTRGHQAITPLFLYDGINAEVSYNVFTGEVEWLMDPALTNVNPVLPTLEKAGVNSSKLKAIRNVWFYARRHGLDPATADRDTLIYGAWGDYLQADPVKAEAEIMAYLNLRLENSWRLLLKYSYFG